MCLRAPIFRNTLHNTRQHIMSEKRIKVWDAPIRLFHWSLLVLVVLAYLSVKTDWLDAEWHWFTGAGITFLASFRLLWGLWGSATARFSQFFPTPIRLVHYFRQTWQGVGHTPAGALSVMAMLLCLLAMITTGLFASDDITLQGPLAQYAGEAFSDQMSDWHGLLFYGLLGLVVLHVLAIGYYWRIRQHALLPAMIHGHATVTVTAAATLPRPVRHRGWRLLASVLLAASLTWLLFSDTGHHLFHPPPPAPAAPTSQHAW